MNLSPQTLQRFRDAGRRGGETRALRLPSGRRRAIAAAAAQARWKTRNRAELSLTSVRLDGLSWDDPAYLEEILSDGTSEEWSQLYRRIWDKPFGSTSAALEKVLSHTPLYGVRPLWRGLLQGARGGTAR